MDSKGNNICINNIKKFIDDHANDCDFIGIQEYNNLEVLREKSFKLATMGDTHSKPLKYGPITFYDKTKYGLDVTCHTMKFEFGIDQRRPIIINFFNDNLCVINVHAGHFTKPTTGEVYQPNDITTFNLSLKTYLETIKECKDTFIRKLKTYNIIMLGDMNSTIKDFSIIIDDVQRDLYGGTKEPTCCSDLEKLDGKMTIVNLAFDHVLNSFSKQIKTVVYHNLSLHSDHNPVITTITV